MAELNLCPVIIDICISRGDTNPFTFTIVDEDDAVVNITGFSYLLTVDPSESPVDASGNLFGLVGTVTDGPNGVVEFGMSLAQSDQTPQVYFHDTQQTDGSSNVTTVARGRFEIQQDITK